MAEGDGQDRAEEPPQNPPQKRGGADFASLNFYISLYFAEGVEGVGVLLEFRCLAYFFDLHLNKVKKKY